MLFCLRSTLATPFLGAGRKLVASADAQLVYLLLSYFITDRPALMIEALRVALVLIAIRD